MNIDNSNAPDNHTTSPAQAAKSSAWSWLLPSLFAMVVFKVFGVAGGLVTFCSYYLLEPKVGKWWAVAASTVIGACSAIGLMSLL